MKALMVLAVLLSSVVAGDFELGFIVGEPTGLSLKLWTGRYTAVDGAIAWNLSGKDRMQIHCDYLVHSFGHINSSGASVPLYYGIGGRLQIDDDTVLGARIPVGLTCLFHEVPLDLFVEIAPVLDLIPDVEFNFNGGIGLRFVF